MPVENIVGKGENAGDQHFLLFPQSFRPNQNTRGTFILSPANTFNLVEFKIMSFVRSYRRKVASQNRSE